MKFAITASPARMVKLRWLSLFLACILLANLGLTPSAQAQTPPPLPPNCVEGTLDAQLTLICVPNRWNGTLLVYAHGFVRPQEPLALPYDQIILSDGVSMPSILLPLGFAFATTSFSRNGYAVEQGSQDVNDLVEHFRSLVPPGTLKRVLLTGGSQGSLITTMLIETRPDLYAGGLAVCGPVGGAPAQVKFLADFRVVFDYYFPDVFPFGSANVPVNAYQDWDTVYVPAITNAILSNPTATNQLFKVTGASRDPADPTNSAVNTALEILGYSIFETNDLIATAGGMPFDNRFTHYRGSSNDAALNAGVERVSSTPAARAYMRNFYQTTGLLQRPLVLLHTLRDSQVPFFHNFIYAHLVQQAGRGNYLTVLPVPAYGHCNFTAGQVLGSFALLLAKTGGEVPPELQGHLSSLPEPLR